MTFLGPQSLCLEHETCEHANGKLLDFHYLNLNQNYDYLGIDLNTNLPLEQCFFESIIFG